MKTFTVRETAHKGIEFKYSKEGPNEIFGIPVGASILQQFQKAGHEEATCLLHWFDVVDDNEKKRIVKEQRMHDRNAVVLVETFPGIGGTIKLFSNLPDEERCPKSGRIIRTVKPFPSLGVTLLAERKSPVGDHHEWLVHMEPGSSFRIVRNGKLYDHAAKKSVAPELVVLWKGRWDRLAAQDKGKWGDMKNWGLSVYDRAVRHGEL